MTFDAITYFQEIQQTLKIMKGQDRFFKVTGIGNLEELIAKSRNVRYPVICVDDSQDGYITEMSEGFMDSRYYSVFILTQVKVGNNRDRVDKMAEVRTVFAKVLSRMIADMQAFRGEMIWMHPNRIKYDEVGYLGDNLFGIHFGFTVETPEDLRYNESDWDTEA